MFTFCDETKLYMIRFTRFLREIPCPKRESKPWQRTSSTHITIKYFDRGKYSDSLFLIKLMLI